MSSPGPASPVVLVAPRRVEGVRSGAGASRGQRRLPCRRDPRARRGERVREVDAARDRERLPRSRRGRRRGRRARRGGASLPPRRRRARSRHRLPDVLARACTCRWPRTSTSRRRPTSGRRTDAWTDGRPTGSPSSSSTSRRPRPRDRLSLAERQLLEVVKALLAEPKVLLLDEPTTALGPEDVDRLHALVHERSRAGVGIVYVSHRLPGGPRHRRSRSASSATASARGRSRPPRCRRSASSRS